MRIGVTALSIVILLGGCATRRAAAPTLYERLGGEPGVSLLVETLLGIVAEDLRIVKRFANADIAKLQTLLEEQICDVADGPCTYSGRDMLETHRGMKIREAEFNALVEDLQLAMTRLSIPNGTQNELLAKLAPMHRDIVDR